MVIRPFLILLILRKMFEYLIYFILRSVKNIFNSLSLLYLWYYMVLFGKNSIELYKQHVFFLTATFDFCALAKIPEKDPWWAWLIPYSSSFHQRWSTAVYVHIIYIYSFWYIKSAGYRWVFVTKDKPVGYLTVIRLNKKNQLLILTIFF